MNQLTTSGLARRKSGRVNWSKGIVGLVSPCQERVTSIRGLGDVRVAGGTNSESRCPRGGTVESTATTATAAATTGNTMFAIPTASASRTSRNSGHELVRSYTSDRILACTIPEEDWFESTEKESRGYLTSICARGKL